MKDDQKPERNVQQVSPVENFKAATATNKWERANEHYHKNEDQNETSWIRPTANETEQTRPGCEEKFRKGEVFSVNDGIINDVKA